MRVKSSLFYIVLLFVLASCSSVPEGDIQQIKREAKIYPDYTDLTIPVNIAPLNFLMEEEGEAFFLKLTSAESEFTLSSPDGDFRFAEKKWNS